jgi:hypothetical protein
MVVFAFLLDVGSSVIGNGAIVVVIVVLDCCFQLVLLLVMHRHGEKGGERARRRSEEEEMNLSAVCRPSDRKILKIFGGSIACRNGFSAVRQVGGW